MLRRALTREKSWDSTDPTRRLSRRHTIVFYEGSLKHVVKAVWVYGEKRLEGGKC